MISLHNKTLSILISAKDYIKIVLLLQCISEPSVGHRVTELFIHGHGRWLLRRTQTRQISIHGHGRSRWGRFQTGQMGQEQ